MKNNLILIILLSLILLAPLAGVCLSVLAITDKIQAFMAYSTLLAVVVALFGEKLWEYVNRPVLQISFRLAPPDCHQTQMKSTNFSFAVYYFRFLVENTGKNQAEECEVVLEQIFKEDNHGHYVGLKNYTPVTLKWSGTRNPYTKTIQPSRKIYCDLGRVQHPDYTYKSIYVSITDEEQQTNKFAIELAPSEYYYSQWDSLIPGKYRLKVAVYSKNASRVTRTFDLAWSGRWQDDDGDMFRELVIS